MRVQTRLTSDASLCRIILVMNATDHPRRRRAAPARVRHSGGRSLLAACGGGEPVAVPGVSRWRRRTWPRRPTPPRPSPRSPGSTLRHRADPPTTDSRDTTPTAAPTTTATAISATTTTLVTAPARADPTPLGRARSRPGPRRDPRMAGVRPPPPDDRRCRFRRGVGHGDVRRRDRPRGRARAAHDVGRFGRRSATGSGWRASAR